MIKIYHNPRCKKSRAGLAYLMQKNQDIEIFEYLKNTLTEEEIKEILKKTNLAPLQLVRTQEAYFKKSLKGRNFTENEWIRILSENPILLQRPIVVAKHKAVIGDPPENIDKVL